MKKLIFLSILLISHFVNAQIGIGTNTPSANVVLDVNSTNKGLMLPRLNNTAAVSNPTAGLIISMINPPKHSPFTMGQHGKLLAV